MITGRGVNKYGYRVMYPKYLAAFREHEVEPTCSESMLVVVIVAMAMQCCFRPS